MVCNVYLFIFPLQIIFNKLEIDAKQIHFAAATLRVFGTNSNCDLSVAFLIQIMKHIKFPVIM